MLSESEGGRGCSHASRCVIYSQFYRPTTGREFLLGRRTTLPEQQDQCGRLIISRIANRHSAIAETMVIRNPCWTEVFLA